MRKMISTFAAAFTLLSTAQAGQVWLTMDHVRPYKLEKPAQDIVIGNPGIADVTVQDASNLLLFGKSPGMTNIFIMGENGEVIENMIIRVRTSSTEMLTFYRGSARTTYNCTSNCEATVTIGDDSNVFGQVAGQINQKFNQAAQGAASSTNAGD